MKESSFIDTNILVYAYDTSEPEKQRIAQKLIAEYIGTSNGIISVQVLSECYVVLRRKGFSALEAREIVEKYKNLLIVLPISVVNVSMAMVGVEANSFSYWDALIWATAKSHNIASILTEDGPTGSQIGGVTFINPFKKPF
jgi:predicted nucleic acid-binding protein